MLVRQQLLSYFKDKNGGVNYEELYLTETMDQFRRKAGTNLLRRKDSVEATDQLVWQSYPEQYPGIEFIRLRELVSRMAFASGFADAMIELIISFKLPHNKAMELFATAFFCPSVIQFRHVLERWKARFTYDSFFQDHLSTLYYKECQVCGLSPEHGRDPCFQTYVGDWAPGVVKGKRLAGWTEDVFRDWEVASPEEEEAERHCLRMMLSTLNDYLSEAEMVEDHEDFIKRMAADVNLPRLGVVRLLSFFPLACLLGLVTSQAALESSLKGFINKDADYAANLKDMKCKNENGGRSLVDSLTFYLHWSAAKVENGICATFRRRPVVDLLFKGMRMYDIRRDDGGDGRIKVWVKEYGQSNWMTYDVLIWEKTAE